MNYRHIYHAGNFADVFKHIVLMLCIDYLKQKEKPFFLLDTHAGVGRYNLESEQAEKTREASDGIARLWAERSNLPETLIRYVTLIKRYNRSGDLRIYPGSPLIMKDMMRAGDRMIANELHPEDVHALRQALGGNDGVKVERMDGYRAWKAFVPPVERRGLVLVDPPFEARDEFELMMEGLRQAYKRWATGIYALWYPIKDIKAVRAFHEEVRASGIPDCRALDFYLRREMDETILNGCGLLIVNAPWTLVEQMDELMPLLIDWLTGGQGQYEMGILAGE
jgi:23S rRNA (adenine2030-N6)-methyltransferase